MILWGENMFASKNELVNKMDKAYKNIKIRHKNTELTNLKSSLYYKGDMILTQKNEIDSYYRNNNISKTLNIQKFMNDMELSVKNFNEMAGNIEAKLLLYVIGDGKAGKSTSINALIGKEVAKTNFLPCTRIINIYTSEIKPDKALVKYINGTEEFMSQTEAQKAINKEEELANNSKKKADALFKEQKQSIKGIDAKKQLRTKLYKEILYEPKIYEIRWGVPSNEILDKCLLVDTPGLDQEEIWLFETQKTKSYGYVSQADAILWIIDGNSIVGRNTRDELNNVNDFLKNVGGIQNNIIGVINGMDKVKSNGGDAAIEGVLANANAIYHADFEKMIPISALQGYDGKNKNDIELIKESNIRALESAIKNVFISSANEIKFNSKRAGKKNLEFSTIEKMNAFLSANSDVYEDYKKKKSELQELFDRQLATVLNNLHEYFESIKGETSKAIYQGIYRIEANEFSSQYINANIFNIDDLKGRTKIYLANVNKNTQKTIEIAKSKAVINEYKFLPIKNELVSVSKSQKLKINISYSNIDFFTYKTSDSIILNMAKGLYKMYVNNKNRQYNIDTLINSFDDAIDKMSATMKADIKNMYSENKKSYLHALQESYKNIYYPVEYTEYFFNIIEIIIDELQREEPEITITKILTGTGDYYEG